MHCPFHDDQTPSLSVNRDKGVFNCHAAGCDCSGNVLDFVLAMEVKAGRLGKDDVRASAERLAEKHGHGGGDAPRRMRLLDWRDFHGDSFYDHYLRV